MPSAHEARRRSGLGASPPSVLVSMAEKERKGRLKRRGLASELGGVGGSTGLASGSPVSAGLDLSPGGLKIRNPDDVKYEIMPK